MTPAPSGGRQITRQRPGGWDYLRAAGALVALVALVAGVPVALLLLGGSAIPGGLPASVPTWHDLVGRLSRPDDGRLFLTTLVMIGWAAWGAFAVSVAVEIVAVLRRTPTPRLPLLQTTQRAAAVLIAAVAVASSAAPTLSAAAAARPALIADHVTPPQPDPADASTGDPAITNRPGSATHANPTAPARASATATADQGHGGTRDAPTGPEYVETDAPARPATAHPTVRVERGDTLWRLAERHLGGGERFVEIAQLNYGRPQTDGAALTSSHWINPGWLLRLPDDAVNAASHPQTGEAESTTTQAVHAGDTLWDIADQRLGDPHRYIEIADLTRDIRQPDGRHLHDPDEIRPGWVLRLPDDHADEAPSTTAPGNETHPRGPQPAQRTPDELGSPLPARPEAAAEHAESPSRLPPEDRPSTPTATPSTTPTRSAEPSPGPTSQADAKTTASEPVGPHTTSTSQVTPPDTGLPGAEDGREAPAALILGLGAVAAAGIVTELARRRRRLQRHRRPGQRLPRPAPAAAAVEQTLRAASDTVTVDTVRSALRQLAAACAANGVDLPRLTAIRMNATEVELLLAEQNATAVEPFVAVDARRWRLEPTSLTEATSLQATEMGASPPPAVEQGSPGGDDFEAGHLEAEPDDIDPYPALVTLGVQGDSMWLANLEAAGRLTLLGDPAATMPVLRAIAAELATSSLAATAQLWLGDGLTDLGAVIDPARRLPAGVASSIAVEAHTSPVSDLLRAADVADLHQARSRGVCGDAWTPHVHLAAHPAEGTRPWSGVITVGQQPDAAADLAGQIPSGWTMRVGADLVSHLQPLDVTLHAQGLNDTAYAHLIEILASAAPLAAPEPIDELAPGELAAGGAPAQNGHIEKDAVLAALPVLAPTATETETRPTPNSVDASAAAGAAPRVLVIGPPAVDGGNDAATPGRRRRATELVAYLMLHPGATTHQIDDALWPGRRVGKQTRNSFVSRARAWLGTTADGHPYLPLIAEEGDYRLRAEVTCDWHDLAALARRGLQQGPDGIEALQAALSLVRGRPFVGIDPATYAWAESDTQDMISAIVDVAHTLAGLLLARGDHRGAQHAAVKGLLADSCSELLYRDAIRAAAARGDIDEVTRLADRLRTQIERLDPDSGLEDETSELLQAVRASKIGR